MSQNNDSNGETKGNIGGEMTGNSNAVKIVIRVNTLQVLLTRTTPLIMEDHKVKIHNVLPETITEEIVPANGTVMMQLRTAAKADIQIMMIIRRIMDETVLTTINLI